MASVNVDCPTVSLLRFIVMGRILKVMIDFDAVTVFVYFSSLTLMKPVPGVKEKNTEMAFNGSGIRDTARVLKVSINTVIRTLKNSRQSG